MNMPSAANVAPAAQRNRSSVLGAPIDALSWEETLDWITAAAARRQSACVCACNVHSVVTGHLDAGFRRVLEQADLALPDGAPVAWALRRMGHARQERINGPDLMWRYLAEAEQLGQSVYFYGSTSTTLAHLRRVLARAFPQLQLAGMHAPPFRALSAAEDAAEVAMIRASGAQVVLVSLGCPKQEKWMAAHRGRLDAVMMGVGAAFDYHAGLLRRAPRWCQRLGLEWLFRLLAEPRRLLRRCALTNTIFVLGISWQLGGRLWNR